MHMGTDLLEIWSVKVRCRSRVTSKYFTNLSLVIGLPSRERDSHEAVDRCVKQIASDFSMLIATRHFLSQSRRIAS